MALQESYLYWWKELCLHMENQDSTFFSSVKLSDFIHTFQKGSPVSIVLKNHASDGAVNNFGYKVLRYTGQGEVGEEICLALRWSWACV